MRHRTDLVIELPVWKKSPKQEKPWAAHGAAAPHQAQRQQAKINQQQPCDGLHPLLQTFAPIVTNLTRPLPPGPSV
jgi:hypothetical protein